MNENDFNDNANDNQEKNDWNSFNHKEVEKNDEE